MDAKSEKATLEERENLLDYESQDEDDDTVVPPPPPYGSTQQPAPEDGHYLPKNEFLRYIYLHRKRIPGYGMIYMVRNVRLYALYVLLMMLIAYLLNQLDRYTLPIVTKSAGYDLRYGELVCMKTHNKSVLSVIDNKDNGILPNTTTDLCGDDDYKDNMTACLDLTFELNGSIYEPCEWAHDGSGLLYQIVAGPVFNNLYPLAGIFTGFLADYGYRIVWLVISLTFWSVITGLTGFIKQYWHLVLLRALLAIGAAGCTPFAVSIIGDYFPADLRGTAISIYYFGIYIGYSLAFAIGNGIVDALNWRWVFFLSGLIGIAVAPIILISVREPKRTKNLKVESEKPVEQDTKPSFASRLVLLIKTFLYPGMFMLCIAGGIRNAGGYVWAYNTELFFQAQNLSNAQINHFMSWIPLVGGSLGAIFGGFISDLLVKNRSTYVRIWVLIVSQILAAPFAAGALFLPYPWCFISLIPSNLFGEMWVGVTSAIVVDLAPTRIRTGVVAVYLFIITIIGGNFNLIVTPVTQGFEKHFSKLTSYRFSLTLSFPGLYALSSVLFVFAFLLMRLDLKRKQRLEGQVNSINDGGAPHDRPVYEEEEEDVDKPV